MLLSYVQTFANDLVKLAIYTLWFFDYFAQLPKKKLFFAATNSVLIFILALSYINTFIFLKSNQNLFDSYVTYYSSSIVTPNILGASDISPAPSKIADIESPIFTARSVLAVDKVSDTVLYSYNPTEQLALASTTKLMTALVSLDLYEENDFITIPDICTTVASTKAWLPVGSVFKFEDLLHALLISSAGDAACTLATTKVGYDEFVERMNLKAEELGMMSTNFTNPIGLDGLDNSHFSTAEDLYKLAYASMDANEIKDIVAKPKYTMQSLDKSFSHQIFSTNALLNAVPGTVGIKTGTTQSAGEVFIYEYENEMKDIVIIVMGSKDRFTDTRNILDWVLSSYSWPLEN